METIEMVETKTEEKNDWREKQEPAAEPTTKQATTGTPVKSQLTASYPAENGDRHLLSREDIDSLRSRWERIQIEFVDEPRRSVEQADKLITELINRLAHRYSERRASLEGTADNGGAFTEDLRIALQEYRSFFNRMLEV